MCSVDQIKNIPRKPDAGTRRDKLEEDKISWSKGNNQTVACLSSPDKTKVIEFGASNTE